MESRSRYLCRMFQALDAQLSSSGQFAYTTTVSPRMNVREMPHQPAVVPAPHIELFEKASHVSRENVKTHEIDLDGI